MLPFYLGVYILILIVVWGFFFVARHHAFRYKNFSNYIVPVTNILFAVLLVLSISGMTMVFKMPDVSNQLNIGDTSSIDLPVEGDLQDTTSEPVQEYYY